MAKFSNPSKLPKRKRQNLMLYFCRALTSLKKPEEAARFLTDLLSPQEAEMLAKRLKIAQLLTEEKTYEEIRSKLRTSFATIARVHTWLTLSGEGFRLAINRTIEPQEKATDPQEMYDPFSWHNVKRKYHWPQYLIEQLMEQSDQKQREKITSILARMEVKDKLFKDINKDIYELYTKPQEESKKAKKIIKEFGS